MNVVLWVLQILLGLHTGLGAMWKLSNSEQAVPSLSAIPHGIWLTLSVVELLLAVGLLLPALHRPAAVWAPIAAACIAVEMVIFSGVHLRSGIADHGQMIYWLVVAAISVFVAYGRSRLVPLSTAPEGA